MSVKITTNQNIVTVADADKSITIVNNKQPNRVDIVQPVSEIVYVATPGPQGPAGSGGGGSINTGSLLTTASVNSNTITFTKGDTSQFSITIATGSGADISALNNFSGSILAFTQSIQTQVNGLTNATSSYALTSSFNSFTASYNTGSFTGSFKGSFNGTASWASNATHANTAAAADYAATAGYVQAFATIEEINSGTTPAYPTPIRPAELEQSKYATINLYNFNNFI